VVDSHNRIKAHQPGNQGEQLSGSEWGCVPICRPTAILRASIFTPPFPHEELNCRRAMWECWTADSSHTPKCSICFMLRSLPLALDHLLR
jgi:hypothetical protein